MTSEFITTKALFSDTAQITINQEQENVFPSPMDTSGRWLKQKNLFTTVHAAVFSHTLQHAYAKVIILYLLDITLNYLANIKSFTHYVHDIFATYAGTYIF